MTTHSLNIDPAYGWVLFEIAFIGLHVLLEGFAITPIRKRLFTKAFYEKHFPELTKDRTKKLPDSGYPDMGEGQFSQKLSLDDWMTFGNAQRAHYNYIEGVASIISALAVSGLFFPRYTAILGVVYIVGRLVYANGYRMAGARGRLPGALLIDFALLGVVGGAFYGAFNFGGGVAGFMSLFKF